MRPLRLGHVFGVPVFLTPSWLIVALIVTVSFADVFVRAVPGTNTAAAHLLAFAFALLLAVCVLLHELGHVLTALSLRLKVHRVVIFLFGGHSEVRLGVTDAILGGVVSTARNVPVAVEPSRNSDGFPV